MAALMGSAILATEALAQSQLSASPDFRVPEHVFDGSFRGPHKTGTVEELWIDPRRDEKSTSAAGDKRHLMVQIWYPASFDGDPARAPYALRRDLYSRDEHSSWLDAAAAVRTNSVLDAAVAVEPARFPVLLYNPGAGYPPFSATFQTEFLASHGYVVVSIGHPDITGIERFPDGCIYKRDRNIPAVSDAQRRSMTTLEVLNSWVRQLGLEVTVHVQDISFVLNRLEDLNAGAGRFHGRLDLSRVGALGWSLGGVAALQASRDEPRIKAAVNLDGRLYTDAADTGTHRPILQMHRDRNRASEPGPAGLEMVLAGDSLFWRMYSKTDAEWYDLTLQRATHRHFSDRVLFERADPALMHPRLAHDIVNHYTLEFFDRYLRGRADLPLLSGSQTYPEVSVITPADLQD